MTDKIAKFSSGERRQLRRETAVTTGDTEYFLLPGTVVNIDSCREESLSDGNTRLVYSVFATLVDPSRPAGEDHVMRFEMTQRDVDRHTRQEELQDEPPSRADDQPTFG